MRSDGVRGAKAGAPASSWQCGAHRIDLGRTRVMGVVNVTPDSFSDGGLHATAEAAIAWGLRLLDEGADILDVGGESTRPGFTPVDPAEECRRVLPVIEALAARGAVVSVDTRHAEVARAALAAGACIVNDVSGFSDPAMVAVVAESDCGCVCMHAGGDHLGGASAAAAGAAGAEASASVGAERAEGAQAALPAASAQGAAGAEALGAYVDGIVGYLREQAAMLERAGVARERICIDPGPGFGKTAEQDVAIQRATARFVGPGYPYLCAPSRKRFIGATSGVGVAAQRDAATTGACLAAVSMGARMLRVHDVAGVSEALRCAEALWGTPCRTALVALGANLGDRLDTLRSALAEIDALPLTGVEAVSHAYQSVPAYVDDQPVFANAVARVRTELHPMALLAGLLGIENAHGRVRALANGPRSLDLDLLWMGGESHAGERLTLPHPLMGERDFVLRPLDDVAGPWGGAEAFCAQQGIACRPREERVGLVTDDLGSLEGPAGAASSCADGMGGAGVAVDAADQTGSGAAGTAAGIDAGQANPGRMGAGVASSASCDGGSGSLAAGGAR